MFASCGCGMATCPNVLNNTAQVYDCPALGASLNQADSQTMVLCHCDSCKAVFIETQSDAFNNN